MGRVGRPKKKKGRITTLNVSLSKAEEDLIPQIDQIALREGNKSRSEIVINALREYAERHGDKDPNYQQRISDYGNGSIKTTAFLKAELIRFFEDRAEVTSSEVKRKARSLGVSGERVSEVAESVLVDLRRRGLRVYR